MMNNEITQKIRLDLEKDNDEQNFVILDTN